VSRWLSFRGRIDRPVALILQLLLAPVLGVVMAVVRVIDGSPSIVRVRRVGRRSRSFRMFKVRTMTEFEASGPANSVALAGSGDARITALGRRLRRCRLDELPQLVNVVRGEMALIGPRPEAPEFVDDDCAAWRCVLEARPGIAGPTQLMVHGWEAHVLNGLAAEQDYRRLVLPVKLAIDGWYVDHASPWIDALVVAALLRHVVGGPRDTALAERVRRAVPESNAIPVQGTSPDGRQESLVKWRH